VLTGDPFIIDGYIGFFIPAEKDFLFFKREVSLE
jgi:hypothetical protein